MGTILILPNNVLSSGPWTLNGGATSILDVLDGTSVGNFYDSTSLSSCSLDCIPIYIKLDGVLTHINNLPIGFHVTSLSILASGLTQAGPGILYPEFNFLYGGSTIYNNPNNDGLAIFPINVSISLTGITAFTLFGGHWQFNGSLNSGAGLITFSGFHVSGVYNIISYSWILNGGSSSSVKVEDKIIISSTGDVDLTHINKVNLTYRDPTSTSDNPVYIQTTISSADFIIWTIFEIEFLLPTSFNTFSSSLPINDPAGSVLVSVIGDGTQFSGEVVLGNLTIYIADPSGLYQLIPGKTNDTIYSDKTNHTTNDVKIPNPFIKTGFLP